MSHNPNRAANGGRGRKAKRKYDPHAGHRRTATNALQGVDYGDVRNREVTNRGWRIVHFSGDEFEVVYELISAGSASGKIRNDHHDRSIRVLEGILYILLEGEAPVELRKHQCFSISKGTEYEISSASSRDAEALVCQGPDYETTTEFLGGSVAIRKEPITPLPGEEESTPKVDSSKAKAAAEAIKKERIKRSRARTPVAKKRNEDGTPAGEGRAPLAGQEVTGSNPQPVGSGGYAE